VIESAWGNWGFNSDHFSATDSAKVPIRGYPNLARPRMEARMRCALVRAACAMRHTWHPLQWKGFLQTRFSRDIGPNLVRGVKRQVQHTGSIVIRLLSAM
jgi:hypothetical protein